ncbi:MAG: hypothetical protein H6582_00610 [Crocinitomicaceae bacterium]|nr:hypothetical protein [Crocinitomicaceae bacterium]
MENNKDILDGLKKSQKPEVPHGYFENFSDELMAKIAEKESGLDQFNKVSKPTVPDQFFENFSAELMAKIDPVQEKPSRVIAIKIFGFVTAVAACLLVMFTLLPNDVNTSEAAETNATVTEETITTDELMAFVDEDHIVDFIIENEDINLEMESTDEDVYYIIEEDIEDYYFEEEL